jgi:hypothetical protein
MSLSLTELESATASNRADKTDVEREIAKLRDHRQRTLLSGDIDAIEEIDTQIRRHEIEVEIAAARIQSLNGDLYLAREERKRWANFAATNFVMPDSDELARLIEIVREAEPDLRFDDEEFKRSFWAVGQMWRAAEIDKSRYFVSYVDDRIGSVTTAPTKLCQWLVVSCRGHRARRYFLATWRCGAWRCNGRGPQ